MPEWTEPLSAGGSRGTKADTWSTTQTWCFPLKEAAWRPVAPMLKARTNHASTALNGEVYAVGGEGPLRTPSHPLRPLAVAPRPPAGLASSLPQLRVPGQAGRPHTWAVPPATWASCEARAHGSQLRGH